MVNLSATAAGTQSYFETLKKNVSPRLLGTTGLRVSSIGFGGYRIHPGLEQHRAALELALTTGCNLIDTSTNYGDGESEHLIGETLNHLFKTGRLTREQVVVVSKVGYIQGSNLAQVAKREKEGHPYEDLVEFSASCWHCISPQFIRDQLKDSLNRLGLKRLDVLLLHNPEYFLKAGGSHQIYYDRIGRAFEALEDLVEEGLIQYYGISSNSFPESKESPEFTSLQVCHEIAASIRPDHHFKVAQMPFNLLESEAAFEGNCDSLTPLEYAAKNSIAVLINRPLNAFSGNRMVRLVTFKNKSRDEIKRDLETAITVACQAEDRLAKAGTLPRPAWGHILHKQMMKVPDLLTWREILEHEVLPSVQGQINSDNTIQPLLQAVTAYFEARTSEKTELIQEALVKGSRSLDLNSSLVEQALRVYLSTPGITSVLLGMRNPNYVKQALQAYEPISKEEALHVLREVALQQQEPETPGHS